MIKDGAKAMVALGLAGIITGLIYATAKVKAVPANFYMPATMEVEVTGPDKKGLYNITFHCLITNFGDTPRTYQIVWGTNYWTGEYEEEASRVITLNPGESHHWSWVYPDAIEYYYKGYFTCWLFGGWVDNNSSVGIW